MSSMLVQVCQQLPDLGLLSSLAEGEGDYEHGGDGSVCRPGHNHLHCSQHSLHGYGALPYDRNVQPCAVSWEPGELSMPDSHYWNTVFLDLFDSFKSA